MDLDINRYLTRGGAVFGEGLELRQRQNKRRKVYTKRLGGRGDSRGEQNGSCNQRPVLADAY